MFNLFFKFNREYIHKKIVIQNLSISEDKSEKHIKDYKNSFTLGQPQMLDKEKEFLGFILTDSSHEKRSLENFLVISI